MTKYFPNNKLRKKTRKIKDDKNEDQSPHHPLDLTEVLYEKHKPEGEELDTSLNKLIIFQIAKYRSSIDQIRQKLNGFESKYVSSLNFMVKFYDINEHYYNLLFLLILKI